MIYVKVYFDGEHFLVHYKSINIKYFLCFTSLEAEIAKSVQWLGVSGFDSRPESGIFLPSEKSKPFLGPVSLMFSGLRNYFLRGQTAGSESCPITCI
jgi:hypothetical protein